MSFQRNLENINEGTVVVCLCISSWLALVAVRVDKFFFIPYWAVFLPLWLWKVVVFLGWLVGLIVWYRQRRQPTDPALILSLRDDPAVPYIQAMSVSAFFHLIIVCSEILLCLNLSYPSLDLSYLTILTPLLIVGTLGVFGFLFVMIDSRSTLARSVRNRGQSRFVDGTEPYVFSARPRYVCSFTLELCVAANLLQLLFLIARLDNWIRSNWVVTFIPSFILLAMGFLFCLAGLTVALITYFTAFFIPVAQRRLPVCYYASHLLVVILLCTSLILLGLRLDGYIFVTKGSYSLITIPVVISLFLFTALSSGPGNTWWFGLNRNVVVALFESSSTLQLCANTKITKVGLWQSRTADDIDDTSSASSPSAIMYGMVISSDAPSNISSSLLQQLPQESSVDSQLADPYWHPEVRFYPNNSRLLHLFSPKGTDEPNVDKSQISFHPDNLHHPD